MADELAAAALSVFENSSHLAFIEERPACLARLRGFPRDHD